MNTPQDAVIAALATASTATVATVLLKMGLRNCFIRGARPFAPTTPRRVGRAFTLRFISYREDLFTPETLGSPRSVAAAVEAIPPGSICVAAALGSRDAGAFGDILCARMQERGVAALVTDGVIRDAEGVAGTGFDVWSRGTAAPAYVNALTFINWQEPVDCGGVAIFPDDVILADRDGAVVIPAAKAAAVADVATARDDLDAWVLAQIRQGKPLAGLYPPNAENMALYAASRSNAGPPATK